LNDAQPLPTAPALPMTVPFFHVCLVVEELEPALALLAASVGFEWTSVHTAPVTVDNNGERTETTVRFVYSLQGPPYLEVLERCPGTPWAEVGLHHLGLWSADQNAVTERLEGLGCPRYAALVNDDDPPTGAVFHSLGNGLMVEFVHEAVTKPRLARWLAGNGFGPLPQE
jgi:hypothetical protein